MPIKRRASKHREFRITPEAVDAFKAGDDEALRRALGLRPWQWPTLVDFTAKAVDLGAKIAGPVIEGFRILWRAWRTTTEATQAVIDAFVGLKDRALGAVSEFVTGVIEWLGEKLQPALDALLAPIRAVEGAFEWLKDRVVGNSHVPDMVDGIAAEFQRLEGVMVPQAQAATAGVDRAFSDMGQSIVDPLKQAFKEGELRFDSFREAALSIATRLRDQLIEQAFKPIQDAIAGLFGGGGLGGLLGNIFGGGGGGFLGGGVGRVPIGFRQHGGRVRAGEPVIVGEKRPELFVPDVSGMVLPRVPRAAMGERVARGDGDGGRRSGGGNTFNIDARGADPAGLARVERLIMDLSDEHRIRRIAVDGVADAKQRGHPVLRGRS